LIRIITNIEVAQDKKAFQNFDIDGEIKNKMDAIVEEALIQEGVAHEGHADRQLRWPGVRVAVSGGFHP